MWPAIMRGILSCVSLLLPVVGAARQREVIVDVTVLRREAIGGAPARPCIRRSCFTTGYVEGGGTGWVWMRKRLTHPDGWG